MPKIIDLFAGCGGFSVGFTEAGFDISKAVEFDKQIAESYKKNHPSTNLLIEDIGKIDNDYFFTLNEADIIIGGPPCQGFSMAGARIRGNNFIDDPRNFLFKHYLNIVRIVKPKIFMLENVKGILTINKGEIVKEIVKSFSNSELFDGDKYFISHRVVKASDFGIPQKRERVIIIGTLNKKIEIESYFNSTKEEIAKQDPQFFEPTTIWDAISNLDSPSKSGEVQNGKPKTYYQTYLASDQSNIHNHISTNHSKKAVDRMNKISNGENWTSLNEKINSVHSGSYGRMNKEDASATITTRFDTPSGGNFIHPIENRTITPREAARIQSFPDSFVFYGTKTSICKQIGNAVPPKLSYFFAIMLKTILDENY